MPITDFDKDIPFIIDITEDRDIRDPSPARTRHYSFGQTLQPNPSPYHSRSPSFREDRRLLENKFASVSLEELRRYSLGSINPNQYRLQRKSSSRRSRRSQISNDSKKIPRTHSSRSTSRSPRPSYACEDGVIRRASQTRRRKSSCAKYKPPIVELTEEEKHKENRRKKIVYSVIGMSLFLLLCAILAVVVTLTHQSEVSIQNKTTVYYTFSPHAKVIHGDFLGKQVRRENEELMNSLNREQHSSHNTSSQSVPGPFRQLPEE